MKRIIFALLILSSCAKEVQQEDYCECKEVNQRKQNKDSEHWSFDSYGNTFTSMLCSRDGEVLNEWTTHPPNAPFHKTYYRKIIMCE